MPRPGQVLGLVGSNGTGKSTAMQILAGKLKPNLGMYSKPPEWTEILAYFRGSELQNYFTRLLQDDIKTVIKPQYVDNIPRRVQGKVCFSTDERKRVCCELGALNLFFCRWESCSRRMTLEALWPPCSRYFAFCCISDNVF